MTADHWGTPNAGGPLGPTDPLRRLQAASANYQQTARWLAGSFGALGVALVAGLSLSGLGGLPLWRLALTGVGVAGALLAVVMVIHRTALVAPIEYVTFEEVDVAAGEGNEAEGLRDAIVRHDGLFPSTFKHRAPHQLRAHIARLEREVGQGTSDRLDELRSQLLESRDAANSVLAFANHYEAKRAYERLWKTVLLGVLAFVSGAGLFAWSSSPPEPVQPISVEVEPLPTETGITQPP